jgi:hypothetical protein
MRICALMLAIGFCGCAHAPPDAVALEAKCTDEGGEWTSLQVMHPSWTPDSYFNPPFVCRLPSNDAGAVCGGPSEKTCQGVCLAPPGAKLGEKLATGVCSAHRAEPDGTLVVWGGRVHDRYPNLY